MERGHLSQDPMVTQRRYIYIYIEEGQNIFKKEKEFIYSILLSMIEELCKVMIVK